MKRFLIATLALLFPVFASADWRMIVRVKTGNTLVAAQETASCLGGTVADYTPDAPFALLSLPSNPATFQIAQYAIALGIVDVLWTGDDTSVWSAESIKTGAPIPERGSSLSTIGGRDDVLAKNENYLQQIDWSSDVANSDGRPVRLAILDSGLSRKQTALWNKVDASYDYFGGNADDAPANRDSNGNGKLDEGVGHGTVVAGLVDAVAPKVRLIVAKVADSDGRATAWGIVKGLTFAVSHGAEIVNISLGSENPVPAFANAATWCQERGVLVVAAIGNAGTDRAWYPSRDTGVLCVAGLDQNDTKATFSNYDPKTVSAAPAVGLVSQWWDGGLVRWSGTSFAAPFVAGALADCLRRTTPRTASELIGAVSATGRNIDLINDAKHRGKIGKVLDYRLLDLRLRDVNP